ncbi:hypothetical protein ScPMuIL_010989 [Solemya velum]
MHIIIILYSTGASTLLSNLSDAILQDYNDNVRPYCETNDTTTLTLDVALRQILDLDEPNQLIKLSLWIRMSWSDCRLTWNPSDYDGLESFVSKADRIWIPDLALYDSMEQEIAQIEGSNAKISSDGKVQFNFPATTEIRCKVDVKLFPFDRQACPLKFGMWIHHIGEVDIIGKKAIGDLSNADQNVEWRYLDFPSERHEVKYSCCEEVYPDVTFYLKVKRKATFYVLHIILPYIVTSAIALFSYALPAESGEKVSVGVTILLALTVFLLLLGDTLPPYSDSVPLIGEFLFSTIVNSSSPDFCYSSQIDTICSLTISNY